MGSPRRVLVVDDHAYVRELLSEVLQAHGYEVEEAENGRQALEKIASAEPTVVIMDVKMPEVDGMAALEEIRKRDDRIPVIMITAYGEIQTAVQAMRLGAYDYLTKPLNINSVVYTIKRALEKREMAAQLEALQSQLTTSSAVSSPPPPPAAGSGTPASAAGSSWLLGESLEEICRRATENVERQALQQALDLSKGDDRLAANLLKVSIRVFRSKVKKYGLSSVPPSK